ncbi:MAG TPA: GNAT family N-acetyltransferase [Streptosporangiaceae bacterium]|nr:GNAT family N-acetyltransferase [Streptosporangiaceae bacterium]
MPESPALAPTPEPDLIRRTDRLVLRPFRHGDEAAVLAYRCRADVCRYIPADPMTEASAPAFIADRIAARQLEADGDRMVFAVELDGLVIGDVLVRIAQVGDRQAELGWVFNPDFHGHGYATEAARELVEMSFAELGMHRVWAQLDPRNTASARLCERLGMRHEAHLRHHIWIKGEWTDAAIYAILESERRS